MGNRVRYLAWRLAEPPALPPLAVQSLKVALGCGLAWAAGQALGDPRPFAAVLAVIILMQGHALGSLLNALQFLLGVAAGLVLGMIANRVTGVSAPVVAAVILVSMLLGGWVKVSSQGFNNQIAVSALLVLATGSADNLSRFWETGLGGLIGVLVAAFLWPPNPVHGLRSEFQLAERHIAEDIRRSLGLAGRAGDKDENRRLVRSHAERVDAAVALIGPAEDALRWNPWFSAQLHDLSHLEDRLRLISYLYRTVRALARQSAEAPPITPPGPHTWASSRPLLESAGEAAVEAIHRRLSGQDSAGAVDGARKAIAGFATAAPRERHSVALAAALDDLLTDVQSWRPPNQVRPGRRLRHRMERARGRVGRQPREWFRLG